MIAARRISDWWHRVVHDWQRRRDALQAAIDADEESSHAWLWHARLRVLDYMLARYGGLPDAPTTTERANDSAHIDGPTDGPPARSGKKFRARLHGIADRTNKPPLGPPTPPPEPDYEPPAILLIPRNSTEYERYEQLRGLARLLINAAVVIGVALCPVFLIAAGTLGFTGGIFMFSVLAVIAILCAGSFVVRITASRIARTAQEKRIKNSQPCHSLEDPHE